MIAPATRLSDFLIPNLAENGGPPCSDSEPELCVVCLDTLATEPVGVCVDVDGRRTCPHYFHLACLQQVEGCLCPQCRTRLWRRAPLPEPREEPAAWLRLVSLSGEDALRPKDVAAALGALLPVPLDRLESFVLASWHGWTKGETLLREARIPAVAAAIERALPVMSTYRAPLRLRLTPSGCDSTAKMSLHAAQSAPGTVCDCGRIHALRGDRVRRGLAWTSGDLDGGAGNLGTVVRCDEQTGLVTVRWDYSTEAEPLDHAWPFNPSNHEVVHAPFSELGRPRPQVRGREPWEQEPQLFDHVRVLPDVVEVQQLFDSRPICGCAQPKCRRAFQWSAAAGRHVGRTGYVMQKDSAEGSVVVEFTGRCHCTLSFPLGAVERVQDQDSGVDSPRFAVNAKVECRLVDQWFLGTVMRLRWREKGWGDRRTAPYIVRLDDGRTVFAPLDSDGCVRAISGQADAVARVSVQDMQRSSPRTRQPIARRSQSGRSVTPRRASWEWEGC